MTIAPSSDGARPGALAGVRVLEFAQALAVPVCGVLLADMGADVIKIEPPAGDAIRYNLSPILPDESKSFTIYNRGKRSICVDVSKPESRAVVERLVASADVVLMSFKLGDLARYGLTYERFAEARPDLIYLEHAPFGPEGELGLEGGYDIIVQGMSGLGAISARSDGTTPQFARPAVADIGTGFLSALAVVSALRHRDRTGEGQRVRTSLLSTALTLGSGLLNWFAATDPPLWEEFAAGLEELRERGAGFEEQRALYARKLLAGAHGNVYFRYYRTKDGFMSVGCLSPSLNAKLRKVTGLEDPRQRQDFDASTGAGYDKLTALVRRAEDLFATKTTAEWIEVLRPAGIPCGPFNFPHEVFDEPQIEANEFVVELDHPALGPYKTFAPPVRMDATPTRIARSSPALGADTDEVLSEAGLGADDIEKLRAAGVVGPSSSPSPTPTPF